MLDAFRFQCGYNGCALPSYQTEVVLGFCLGLFLVFGVVLWRLFKSPLAVLLAAGGVFAVTLLPQMFFRLTGLRDIAVNNISLSADEKRAQIFGDAYLFAERSRLLFPGAHTARLVTDINLKEGDGWGVGDRLAYYLYPLDIKDLVMPGREDVILFFHKKDAKRSVPPGYRISSRFNDQDMIALRAGAF